MYALTYFMKRALFDLGLSCISLGTVYMYFLLPIQHMYKAAHKRPLSFSLSHSHTHTGSRASAQIVLESSIPVTIEYSKWFFWVKRLLMFSYENFFFYQKSKLAACVCMYIEVHARTHACTHACMHACTYVHSHTCMQMHEQTHIHKHAQRITHTNILSHVDAVLLYCMETNKN